MYSLTGFPLLKMYSVKSQFRVCDGCQPYRRIQKSMEWGGGDGDRGGLMSKSTALSCQRSLPKRFRLSPRMSADPSQGCSEFSNLWL